MRTRKETEKKAKNKKQLEEKKRNGRGKPNIRRGEEISETKSMSLCIVSRDN
jgi:hypothetical protein